MGDDVNIIVPPEPEPDREQDDTRDEILIQFGQLSARTSELELKIGELNVRIAGLRDIIERGNEYAPIGHSHAEFEQFSGRLDGLEQQPEPIEQPAPEPKEEDKDPEAAHWYFRRLSDL